jgi:hypothetical protein
MAGYRCCVARSDVRPGMFGRIFQFAKWFTPGAVLILIPKCPLCIIAYIAAFTGIGLSVPAASGLRTLLISASVAGLAYIVLGGLLRRCRDVGRLS